MVWNDYQHLKESNHRKKMGLDLVQDEKLLSLCLVTNEVNYSLNSLFHFVIMFSFHGWFNGLPSWTLDSE